MASIQIHICVACHDHIRPDSPKVEVARERRHPDLRSWHETGYAHDHHLGHAKRDGWRPKDLTAT